MMGWFRKSISNPDNLPHYLTAFFTLGLAIFAFYAWHESQKTTAALEGRPLLWIVDAHQPQYDDDSQQLTWDWWFQNIGRAIAYQVVVTAYLKIGDERYQFGRTTGKNSIEVRGSKPTIVPPLPYRDYAQIASRNGVDKNYFNQTMATNFGVGLLVEFDYSDARGKTSFSNSVCIERLATGAFAVRSPIDCPK
jgi:hypothetical protein